MAKALFTIGALVLALGLARVWLVGGARRGAAARQEVAEAPRTAPASTLTAASRALPAAPGAREAGTEPAPGVPREALRAGVTELRGARVLGRLRGAPGQDLGATQLFWTLPAADGGAPLRLLDFPDSDGHFALDEIPPGRALELRLVPDTAPEQLVALAPLAPDELRRLEIALDPGAELVGVVLDEHGAPRGDVQLALEDLSPSDLESLERSELERTLRSRTATDGSFRFGSLARGEWRLRLENTPRPPAPLLVDTRAQDHLELRMLYPQVPELTVLTVGPDGRPIHAHLQSSPPVEFQRRLALGRHRLAGFDGALSLTARSIDGNLVARVEGVVPGPLPLTLVLAEDPESPAEPAWSEGEIFEWNGELEAAQTFRVGTAATHDCVLAGRVLDARGRPAEGVSIQLEELEYDARTNARGEFLLERLPRGPTTACVHDPASGVLSRHALELAPERRALLAVRLEAAEPVTLRGRIQGAWEHTTLVENERGRARLELDEEGRFTLELPHPGRYTGSVRLADGSLRQLVLEAPHAGELELIGEQLPRMP